MDCGNAPNVCEEGFEERVCTCCTGYTQTNVNNLQFCKGRYDLFLIIFI